jgi:hypothetical protein
MSKSSLRVEPDRAHVRVDVYNIAGQRLRRLVDRVQDAGSYTVDFANSAQGRLLPSGVYLVKLRAGEEERTLTVVALR